MNKPVLILYLEDSPRDAELVRDKLQQLAMPHDLRIAIGRAEYEAALAQTRFDLIISDYALPDYDGFAALALALEKQPDVPFILISGTLSEEQAVECLRRGATDYVIKQNLKRLVPAVLRALSEAGEHQQRRAAEKTLLESEKRFMDVLYAARDAILLIEGNKFVDCNEATAQMLGYASRDAFLMCHPSQLSPPLQPDGRKSFEKANEMMHTAIANGSHQFEWVHRRANGEDFPVEVSLTAISYGGKPVLHCLWRDITERKRAAETVRASEQKFRTLYTSMTEGVALHELICDSAGKPVDYVLLDVNPAFTVLTGLGREAVVGRRASEVCGGAAPYLETYADVAITGRSTRFEPTSEPMKKTFSISAFSPAKGEFATVFSDITERKRAETVIMNEQTLNNAIIEGIPGTFYMLDEDGKYVRWSAYQRDEIIGKSDAEVAQTLALDTIHPDDRALILSKIENVLRNDAQEVVEGRVLLRGGPAFVWLLMTGRRIVLNGRPFLVGTGIGITARKQAVTEKGNLEDQLRQAQKMEAVGRLAGGVAHDFNNLLMGIMGYAELCLDKIAPDHPIREWLNEITHDAERSAEITRQLLAFARKQTIAPRVLDLNDAVAGMLKLLRRLIGEDINLAWLPGANLGRVKIDPSQVDQILANLCVNARDAAAGTGKITIETGSTTVDADYCVRHPEAIPGAYVCLAVSDDGCGMDKETLAQVFEPFFTTKGLGKGTGLGLATVYGIVKQNSGFIYAYSEPGKGTTFKIYLPEIAADTVATTVTGKTEAPRGRGETVLLVKDEKSLRVTCGAFLDDLGYKVMVAETPGEALKMVDGHPGDIHVLLTDVVMPGMDGRQLAKRISAASRCCSCPVTRPT